MLSTISLSVVLFVFWLVLSGHYTPFLIGSGMAISVMIALFARRLNISDEEGHPIHLLFSAFRYWPWLVWQIISSAFKVARILVSPTLPISPTLTRVRMSQKTAVGRVTYANSITLTPGTVSVAVEDDCILVHAITTSNALDLESGEMDKRCTRFEGGED